MRIIHDAGGTRKPRGVFLINPYINTINIIWGIAKGAIKTFSRRGGFSFNVELCR